MALRCANIRTYIARSYIIILPGRRRYTTIHHRFSLHYSHRNSSPYYSLLAKNVPTQYTRNQMWTLVIVNTNLQS